MTKVNLFSRLSLLLVLTAQSLQAAIYTVNTTEEDSNPLNSTLSLREAVAKAKVTDTVRLSGLLSGRTIELVDGPIKVPGTVSIDSQGQLSRSKISRSGTAKASRLFEVTGELNLDGIILIGGSASEGGAIHCENGALKLNNCLFTGNHATSGMGGAIFCADSEMTFINCAFSGNLAERGGGLACEDSTCAMINCTLSGNRATLRDGAGGVYLVRSDYEVVNTIMWDNLAGGFSSEANHSFNHFGSAGDIKNVLISGRAMIGVNGLDGTDPDNDPYFRSPVDPLDAPTTAGSLVPRFDSATVNVGSDADVWLSTDLGRRTRQVGRVDLGAYEFQREIIYVDGSGATAGDDGASWATALNFLGDALAMATSGTSIFIAEGIYYPDDGSGRTNGSREEVFNLEDDIYLRGAFPSGGGHRDVVERVTVLSGDIDQDDVNLDWNGITESHTQIVGSNSFNVIRGLTATDIIVDGLTICGGRADEVPGGSGACVSLSSCEAVFTDCQIVGGYARYILPDRTGGSGGGVAMGLSEVDFERCLFSGNLGHLGGGLHLVRSSVQCVSCSFFANEGGAVRESVDENFLQLTNCLFAGNDRSNGPGAIELAPGEATITNCTFSGNRSGGQGGAIQLREDSSCDLINSIIWMNEYGGGTDGELASIFDPSGGMSYSYSLVEHLDLREMGDGNFDGTDPRSVPAFIRPLDPFSAPSRGGDFSLARGSVLRNVGDVSANSTEFDLRGLPRLTFDRIDLGAFQRGEERAQDSDLDCLPDFWERQYSLTNSPISMEASADLDGDGLANFEEFYLGLDPHQPNVQADYLKVGILPVNFGEGFRLHMRWREWGPAEPYVTPFPEQSSDLQVWSRGGMTLNFVDKDQAFNNRVIEEVISPSNPRRFMRLRLSLPLKF